MSAPAGRIGARVKRGDDPRLLTGRGRYVDDMGLPRLVHAAFVRSIHAHARLVRVHLDRACRAPGVAGVLTGDDTARLCKPYRGVLLHYKGMKTGAMLPLAVDRVRYVGEPIVAIAAESRAAADDAAALIDVEYEPLPAVLSPDAALAAGAPVIHPELGDNVLYETRLSAGDVERAFAGAGRVWMRTFTTGRHTGVPIEPRSLIADYEPATRALTVWISTQVPHMMQAVLAELFGLREQRVRVVAPDVGGSFGIKIHVYQDDMAACALAVTLGRPVKFVASRRESFASDIHAREQAIHIEVAADGDGVLTAMRASITAAVGPYSAYPRSSVVEGGQVLRLLPGPYRLRHYDGALRVVAQNKVVTSQYRAVGHPIATAVTESMIDLVARDLGLDPAEARRRNLVRPEDLPYTSAAGSVFDSGSYQAALARLLQVADYDGLRREQATARAAGRHVGRAGRRRRSTFRRHRRRALRRRHLGEPRHADRWERDLARGPRARRADPDGRGRASRGPRGRHRARRRPRGARKPRAGPELRPARARRALPLERAPGRRAEPRGDRALHESRRVDRHQRRPPGHRRSRCRHGPGARTALRRRRRLRAHRQSRARRGPDRRRDRQGLGGALMEHCAYDEAGQLRSTTLMDYAVPTAADVPPIETHHIETPAPGIAGGFKGAGEAGATGAPAAILNAVNDALAPLGVMLTDQPITPERVVDALRRR